MAGARTHVTLDELLRLRHRAKGFSFLPRQPVHSLLVGRHASRLRGRGLDFEELRHYFPGDDTRTIDWSATARLGEAHVRVYTEERDRPVLLLIDQRLSMFFGSRHATKSVIAAEAAALSAWRVTSLGDRVGAIVFSEAGIDEIRPASRDKAVAQVLAAIVRRNQALRADDARPTDPSLFNRALEHAARLLPHDGLLCIISDAAGADAETVRLVTGITAHNDALVVHIEDPLEQDLPRVARGVLADGAGQLTADLSNAGLRRRFAADASSRLEAIADFSRKRAIPVLPLTTVRDTADQLRELLGRRLAKGRSAGAAA